MRKVAQAAGRPFRSTEDKGMVVLMGYRYGMPYCKDFLPTWIKDNMVIMSGDGEEVAKAALMFFG